MAANTFGVPLCKSTAIVDTFCLIKLILELWRNNVTRKPVDKESTMFYHRVPLTHEKVKPCSKQKSCLLKALEWKSPGGNCVPSRVFVRAWGLLFCSTHAPVDPVGFAAHSGLNVCCVQSVQQPFHQRKTFLYHLSQQAEQRNSPILVRPLPALFICFMSTLPCLVLYLLLGRMCMTNSCVALVFN